MCTLVDASDEFCSSVISSDEYVDGCLLSATTSRGSGDEYHTPPLKDMVQSAQKSSFFESDSHHPSLMTTRELLEPSISGSPGLDARIGHNFGNPIPRQSYAPSRSQVQHTFTSGRGHSIGVRNGRAAQESHFSPQTCTGGRGHSLGVGSGLTTQELHFSPLERAASSHDAGKLPCEDKAECASTSSSRSSSLSSGCDAEVRLVAVTAIRHVALRDFACSSQPQQRQKTKPSTRWKQSVSVKDTLLMRERGLRSYGSLAHCLGICSPCSFEFRFDRGEMQFPCRNKMLCDRCHQPHDSNDFVRHRQQYR